MNYKPDESTLIAFHYGELEGEERARVEAWLEKHPEERQRLAEWHDTRTVFASLDDKEVIAPPIVVGDNHRSFWREGYVRWSLGLAASLVLVVEAARLLGINATYKAGELRLGFGTPAPVQAPLSEDQVAAMIQQSLSKNNETLQASWSEDR